jgi:hypothetical protein
MCIYIIFLLQGTQLPPMDGNGSFSMKASGTDGYVQLEYAKFPKRLLRTRYITDKGKYMYWNMNNKIENFNLQFNK